MTDLDLLLDRGRLDGPQPIERVVGPERIAAAVDLNDMADARTAIEDLCMHWGGACGALLPIDRAATGLSHRWRSFLSAGAFDNLATRGLLSQQGGRSQLDGDELGLFATERLRSNPAVSTRAVRAVEPSASGPAMLEAAISHLVRAAAMRLVVHRRETTARWR